MNRAQFLLLFPPVLLLAGCASTQPGAASADQRAVLRVGVTPTLPPMVFKQQRELKGLEIDLARELAASMGRSVEFVEVKWEKQIDSLLNGQTDIIMSGMSVTKARSIRIKFTQPYLRAGQSILARRTEADQLRLLFASGRYRVGVQDATTGDYYLQRNLPTAERVGFRTPREGAAAVASGRIDFFVHDAPINWWLAAENEANGLTVIPEFLTEEYLAWGVRQGDADLIRAANRYLTEAMTSGRHDNLLRRWLPRSN